MNEHYKQMSSAYRQQKTHSYDNDTREAYISARLPATYAVIKAIIERMIFEKNVTLPQTVLDLGSGPGTSILALEDILNTSFNATLIEQDSGFIQFAKKLLHEKYTWICANMLNIAYTQHDWVIASYSLNELPTKLKQEFIHKAFEATTNFLILIEPGTPQGFANILEARTLLIQEGGYISLPCPHALKCPLEETSTWCHTSQRLPRTKLHKTIKNAELGYEDEKYCYLVVSKNPVSAQNARIISTPKKHSGHLELNLCKTDGTAQKEVFSKSKCSFFKDLKKKEWGDEFNPQMTIEDA